MRSNQEGLEDSTNERLRWALGMFLLLQVLDLGTTLVAFKAGGIELNPLVRAFMPFTGRVAAIVMSKALIVILMFLLSRKVWLVRFANMFYSGVVLWNLWIVHSLKANSA